MIGVLGVLTVALLAADTGTRGHGEAATRPRTPPASAGFVANSRFAPAAASFATTADLCRQAEIARRTVSPCRRVPVSAAPADTPIATPRPHRYEADDWLGDDKLKHFLVSFAVTGMSAAGARTVGFGHHPALVVGAGVGVIAGIGKEARDRITGGDVSARDLTWDAVGIALAIVLAGHAR